MITGKNNSLISCRAYSRLGSKKINLVLIYEQTINLFPSSFHLSPYQDFSNRIKTTEIYYELTGHPPSGNASGMCMQKRNIPPWYTPCLTKNTPNHTANKGSVYRICH